MISSNKLRKQFLEFFKAKDHKVVSSSSLVPANDKTLLFTNAGMVQFKDVFLGTDKRDYTRATSSQRCVRAGGKHNDLENVGYTARHHTFFEMLGNFSFGDYFKQEAIQLAWEFLTEVIKLPKEKLWVTIYEDDEEAAEIWLKSIGVDQKRFSRKGKKDNFWQMGDTGPCGPCSEIFYDHGPEVEGGPPGSENEDGDRYVEIWNLVFMQFDRSADGELTPLPKPSVDTGMGLERLAAILQGVHSNYDIDIFRNLIKAASKITNCNDLSNNSLHVIADHIRSCSFLIVDGVLPSNEGRGYVLRRIIRRAIRHGHKLECKGLFFYKLVATLNKEMGEAYPELMAAKDRVESTLKGEEERFAQTLDQGLNILETVLSKLDYDTIPGDTIFDLFTTYGFPVDLTADIARERNLKMDMAGYEKAMEVHIALGSAGNNFNVDMSNRIKLETKTKFLGYDDLQCQTKILHLFKDNEPAEGLSEAEEGIVVLAETPFYAESGGQIGDSGLISGDGFVFEVKDTQKQSDTIFHIGVVKRGHINVNYQVKAAVDEAKRQATVLNHSATHLMHAALRKVLGDHVQQKGSLVNEKYLRFDFSHFEPVSKEQLTQIQEMVNDHIRRNHQATVKVMPMDKAMKSGAIALFGEKYGEKVRVLSIGDFSVELCGGTHVTRAGDIGLFKIISESGVAAGVRRIEAISGDAALSYMQASEDTVNNIADSLKASRENVREKVVQLVNRNRELEKQLDQMKSKLASSSSSEIISQAVDVDGVKVLSARLDDNLDNKALREMLDNLKNKLGSAAIVLGTVADGKVRLVAGVTKDQTKKINAGKLINNIAQQVGGKGGGRPDMAQAGGDNPAALDAALQSVVDWIRTNTP